MTAPAITISPDATIPAAARLMNTHHVRRLPVTDADGKLAGIVSRRDLLSVFLRPDADIIHDTRQVLGELALTGPGDVTVTVKHGVVTLTGTMQPEPGQDQDLRPLALQLIWDIDGVVDVVNKLGEAKQPTGPSQPRPPDAREIMFRAVGGAGRSQPRRGKPGSASRGPGTLAAVLVSGQRRGSVAV